MQTRPRAKPTPRQLSEKLGISVHAGDLFSSSRVVDLHVESYSFYRSFGYDPTRRHGAGLHRALLFSQADLPRFAEIGIDGATWVITANPLRPEADRKESFVHQLEELSALLSCASTKVRLVSTAAEFEEATAQGEHGAFLGVQGANALPNDLDFLSTVRERIIRITLLHMSDSHWGCTSTPRPRVKRAGLSHAGLELVEEMNRQRIGVDLAHIHPVGFWDAVRVHDRSLPLLVTHTGVDGIHPHFRNLDDAQLRAVAESSGVVGIMYHAMYLGDPLLGGRASTIARHIAHAVSVIGDDHVALGSDWDGLICTPRDMPTCLELPRLVQEMLNVGLADESIVKILGSNFLRVVSHLRGTA